MVKFVAHVQSDLETKFS